MSIAKEFDDLRQKTWTLYEKGSIKKFHRNLLLDIINSQEKLANAIAGAKDIDIRKHDEHGAVVIDD